MKVKQVMQLHPGDEVFWTDPEDDPEHSCSRVYQIQSIEIQGSEFLDPASPDYDPEALDQDDWVVSIMDVDGACLECFAHELS